MKAWYSKVRDTELKDGSVRATYVVTFETDNAELKREVEKYLQGIMDRTDRKTENSSEKPNNSTISKMEQVDESQTENPCDGCVCDDGKHLMYCMNCKGIAWKTEPPKVEDEPQTDCAWK